MNAIKNALLRTRSAYLITAAEALSVAGARKQSAAVFRKLLANREQYYAADSLVIAQTKFNLGQELIYGNAADRAEAAVILRSTMDVFAQTYGLCSAAIGQIEFRLGQLKDLDGDVEGAEVLYRKAQRKFERRAVKWLLDHAQVCERLVDICSTRDDEQSKRDVYHFQRTARIVRFHYQMVVARGRHGRYYR